MSDTQWPDFIIRCDHGARGGVADVVQRFRWMVSQDHWVPVRKSAAKMTMLRGNSLDEFWADPGRQPDGKIRFHFEIRCGITNCPNRVPVDNENLQYVFALLAVASKPSAVASPSRGVRAAFSALVMHRSDTEITMTLDSLRLALKYRNEL